MVGQVLDIDTIVLQLSELKQSIVVFAREFREAPFVGDEDLLSAGKFEFRTTQSFDGLRLVLIFDTSGHDHLADVHTSNAAQRFTERTTHTGLKTISAGARQHFVDANDVERVDTHAYVKGVFAAVLHEVFVGTDTSSFECFT